MILFSSSYLLKYFLFYPAGETGLLLVAAVVVIYLQQKISQNQTFIKLNSQSDKPPKKLRTEKRVKKQPTLKKNAS